MTEFPYYSYCRKSTGREFFVPTQTLIAVKLIKLNILSYFLQISSYLLTEFCEFFFSHFYITGKNPCKQQKVIKLRLHCNCFLVLFSYLSYLLQTPSIYKWNSTCFFIQFQITGFITFAVKRFKLRKQLKPRLLCDSDEDFKLTVEFH